MSTTHQAKWEGNAIHMPVSSLLSFETGATLPHGPPSTAPLDSGKWSVTITKSAKQWHLEVAWSADAARVKDLFLGWKIEAPGGNDEIKGLDGLVEIGSVLCGEKKSSCFKSYYDLGALNKHLAARSRFVGTVVRFEAAVTATGAVSPAVKQVQATFKHLTSPRLDVSFTFPDSDQSLHANSDLLKVKSAAFKQLLSVPLIKKEPVSCNTPGQAAIQLELVSVVQSTQRLRSYTVSVTNSDFDTIAALVLWVHTGHITFHTPPAEAGQHRPPPAKRARTDTATRPAIPPADSATLPTLSWQAAFRAAEALGMPALKAAALGEFSTKLTAETAAGELFGPMSAAHAEVRAVALEYVVGHAEVMGSKRMEEMQRLVGEGRVEKGGEIAMDLAMALARR